jgi:hypothetical protein
MTIGVVARLGEYSRGKERSFTPFRMTIKERSFAALRMTIKERSFAALRMTIGVALLA